MITFATKATKLKLESWLNFRKTWALKRFHFSNHAKNQKGVMHYMMGPFKKKRKYCHAKKLTPHLLIFWLLSLAWIIFSLTVQIFYIFIAKKNLVNISKFCISYSSENSILDTKMWARSDDITKIFWIVLFNELIAFKDDTKLRYASCASASLLK